MNILIIEDHQILVEVITGVISAECINAEIKSLKSLYSLSEELNRQIDLAIVDINLKFDNATDSENGIDIAMKIIKKYPRCKIIICTSANDIFTIYRAHKELSPKGIFVKSDFNLAEFTLGIRKVLNDQIYYTKTAHNSLSKYLENNSLLDDINRKILILLSQGIKTKNLPQHLNISLSTVDKRKNQIKTYLNIDSGNDEEIIKKAKVYGYI